MFFISVQLILDGYVCFFCLPGCYNDIFFVVPGTSVAAAEAMPSLSVFYLLSLFIYTTCLRSASAKGDYNI